MKWVAHLHGLSRGCEALETGGITWKIEGEFRARRRSWVRNVFLWDNAVSALTLYELIRMEGSIGVVATRAPEGDSALITFNIREDKEVID
jgi:hypothetical protein